MTELRLLWDLQELVAPKGNSNFLLLVKDKKYNISISFVNGWYRVTIKTANFKWTDTSCNWNQVKSLNSWNYEEVHKTKEEVIESLTYRVRDLGFKDKVLDEIVGVNLDDWFPPFEDSSEAVKEIKAYKTTFRCEERSSSWSLIEDNEVVTVSSSLFSDTSTSEEDKKILDTLEISMDYDEVQEKDNSEVVILWGEGMLLTYITKEKVDPEVIWLDYMGSEEEEEE